MQVSATDAASPHPNQQLVITGLRLLNVRDFQRPIIDRRGVGTGDRMLQLVAQASLRSLRQIDVVTRYGAHEFAALLPNTHLAGALTCADRLLYCSLVSIKAYRRKLRNSNRSYSCSMRWLFCCCAMPMRRDSSRMINR